MKKACEQASFPNTEIPSGPCCIRPPIQTLPCPFCFYAVDCRDGKPLPNAAFQLFWKGKAVAGAVSAFDGLVTFPFLRSASYLLKESVPPAGYGPHRCAYTVCANENGLVCVNGTPARSFVIGYEAL